MPSAEIKIPKHLAVIMDGNGRWATNQKKKRSEGHREGANAIDRLMDASLELGIKNISLYTFSTENWKRPVTEIQAIFSLLIEFIDTKLDNIKKKNIRIIHSGARNRLSSKVLKKLDFAMEETAQNTALVANFCLNYGSREEILSSFNRLTEFRRKNNLSLDKKITEKEFEKFLYTKGLPDVDLMIRTAGEQRISNFLLWQSAYSELYFTEKLWPQFNQEDLLQAVKWYSNRKRKFGGLLNE